MTTVNMVFKRKLTKLQWYYVIDIYEMNILKTITYGIWTEVTMLT